MMNVPAITTTISHLPTLVADAAAALANARDAAEVLEARDMAALAYDAAKRAARLAKAKQAHDELITAAHRAQAHALQIEAQAKIRLADEYDAAQERGEVSGGGRPEKTVPEQNGFSTPTAADVGFSRKDVHEARLVRDAELVEPGIVQRKPREIRLLEHFRRAADARQTEYRAQNWAQADSTARRFRGKAHAMRKMIALTLLLGGCMTAEESERADLRQYLGRPARVFSEEKGLAPISVHDRPNGQRVYLFPYGMCRFTILASPRDGDGQYVTDEIRKQCG